MSHKQQNVPGAFLQSKQMIFGADKKLVPSAEAGQYEQQHMSGAFNSNNYNSYGRIMNNSSHGMSPGNSVGGKTGMMGSDYGSAGNNRI